jgi:hypothetical protein
MKKPFLWFVLAAIVLCSTESFCQMDRGAIRKNNRRMMTYRGKKSSFSKEKRYVSMAFTLNALNYYGDLAPNPSPFSTDISFTRPAIGLSVSVIP